MNKKILYYIAALLWGAPGVVIAVKGIQAYLTMPTERLWWLLLITAFVLMCFYLMFRKAVNKYSARIAGLPRKTTPLADIPTRRMDSDCGHGMPWPQPEVHTRTPR